VKFASHQAKYVELMLQIR